MDLYLNRRSLLAGLASGSAMMAAPALAVYTNDRVTEPGFASAGARWLAQTFGETLSKVVAGTPFSKSLVCAIAYQETGYVWFTKLRHQMTPQELLRLLVLDNSSPRSVFPRDTAAFAADKRFGSLASEMVAASDASRQARGIKPTGKLLYGYGLFQNDLQNIEQNPEFWSEVVGTDAAGKAVHGIWGDIEKSAKYFLGELTGKFEDNGRNHRLAVQRYNGRGPSSRIYVQNV
ncbi:hypothetical protein [Novosphingobium capsulatum]|uniref:hypothetical protein n=1 Tax=Novosphingobium capsulatum TaxID=13688 RepID=UPI002E1164C7|nr:hypothetical protein U0041_03700 [Novosphingobium capsulatum]